MIKKRCIESSRALDDKTKHQKDCTNRNGWNDDRVSLFIAVRKVQFYRRAPAFVSVRRKLNACPLMSVNLYPSPVSLITGAAMDQ